MIRKPTRRDVTFSLGVAALSAAFIGISAPAGAELDPAETVVSAPVQQQR
ncbi:hypothetical protein [Kocuria flava]|uniref:Uncharacterized protein n=1 Tax=Kocuria flava TaxID=446860 RepID=A0ABQ0X4Y0_9MICC|nr:hypothetical protein [Kocuria flava]GEO90869.1 hypothetical protein KFL01_01750 [Kocuria flava]